MGKGRTGGVVAPTHSWRSVETAAPASSAFSWPWHGAPAWDAARPESPVPPCCDTPPSPPPPPRQLWCVPPPSQYPLVPPPTSLLAGAAQRRGGPKTAQILPQIVQPQSSEPLGVGGTHGVVALVCVSPPSLVCRGETEAGGGWPGGQSLACGAGVGQGGRPKERSLCVGWAGGARRRRGGARGGPGPAPDQVGASAVPCRECSRNVGPQFPPPPPPAPWRAKAAPALGGAAPRKHLPGQFGVVGWGNH